MLGLDPFIYSTKMVLFGLYTTKNKFSISYKHVYTTLTNVSTKYLIKVYTDVGGIK